MNVIVSNIVSKCSGSCSFQWSQDATPQVTSIDVSIHTAIAIAGTGFDAVTLSNNVVNIGDYKCNVLTATATLITCAAGIYIYI